MSIDLLRFKLSDRKRRVKTRYDFYEMKHIAHDFRVATPPELYPFYSVLGWCAKSVDALADRLVFREFENDIYGMNEIFARNNPDIMFDSAILSALISSCCFIDIGRNDDGSVRLDVIDGSNATGTIDPVTGLLKEGYAILDVNENHAPSLEAYYLPDRTEYYVDGKLNETIYHNAGHPLLVPVIYRPDAKRPFGHSRISRACMSIVDGACRTIKRSEIASEYYSYPQKYVLGLSDDVEIDEWKASMSSMLTIGADEDGNRPVVGQFTTQSMTPHVEMLKMFASMFAGESGLTLDDLGFVTNNPSSAEAIKASHETLRLTARKAQRDFGTAFLNVGFLASCVENDFSLSRDMLSDYRALWEPIFEPDSSMLSSIGDGVIKINQSVPDFFTKESLRNLTGIETKLEE